MYPNIEIYFKTNIGRVQHCLHHLQLPQKFPDKIKILFFAMHVLIHHIIKFREQW